MARISKVPDREPIAVPEPFQQVWTDWIEYKKTEKGQKYKTNKTEQIALDHLIEISHNDPEIAKQIVHHSMRNLYQGLFPLKNQQYGFNPNGNRPQTNTEGWAEWAFAPIR